MLYEVSSIFLASRWPPSVFFLPADSVCKDLRPWSPDTHRGAQVILSPAGTLLSSAGWIAAISSVTLTRVIFTQTLV